MTAIELRQKLIEKISRMSMQKLLFLEQLIQSLEHYFPGTSVSDLEESEASDLDPPLLEDDPIIGMCTGKISNLSERAEEILERGIQRLS